MKIVFANTLMEICDSLPGCNVDQVTDALKLADKRLISPAYLSGGMGDGGGCHPRDNIAMSPG
jgi:UDPglucose 6-dehydrogenase